MRRDRRTVALTVMLGGGVLLATALLAAATAQANTLEERRAPAANLRDRALSDPWAYSFVEQLTTRFGARPAGFEAERAAAVWGAGQLTRAGLVDVRIEPFSLVRWRQSEALIDVVAPARQSLVATLLGGSPPIANLEGDAVLFRAWDDLLRAPPGSLVGRIAVLLQPLRRTDDGSDYVATVAHRYRGPSEAARRGALGFIMRSLTTHDERAASSGATADDATIPSFALAPTDATQLERLAADGPVRLRLHAVVRRDVGESQNIVADLPGRDPRAGWLVVGAHLDSWEQGTGAVDDGFGLAAVTGAVRLIAQLPVRPRRGIRVVWFGAEEVTQPAPVRDVPGARAYRMRHADELASYRMVGESDWGAGRVVSLSLPAEVGAATREDIRAVLAPLGISLQPSPPKTAGPDVLVLQQVGIPAFRLNQSAETMFDVHHTPNDVLERIDRATLAQDVAAWAALLWLLADNESSASTSQPH